MDADQDHLAALIDLHRDLERQGPGDAAFSREILLRLPALPTPLRIADLGCGSGAGALVLARHFGRPVRAVDVAPPLIEALKSRVARAGLAGLVEPIVADMGSLDWPAGSVDLIWSEGAAYNLGFERALAAWRPLLSPRGVAVLSELSWFTDTPPATAQRFWATAYPTMGSEAENVARARRAGYEPLFTERLPSELWWSNYYGPLRERLAGLPTTAAHVAVRRDTEREMALFERFSDAYGYTFYALRAAG
jgi:ubiquinone/menaquinone biosynthesis C-methylase UbiE